MNEKARNYFYYLSGLVFLLLAKTKNTIFGYTTPKPYPLNDYQKCIDYDFDVVNNWLRHLHNYKRDGFSISGKNILEIGPGSDLGVGIYLLSLGAEKYNALDINNLMESVPEAFYTQMLEKLPPSDQSRDIDALNGEIVKHFDGDECRLNYVVRRDFDAYAAFGNDAFDLFFSQAAFEHFDDIDKTIGNLSKTAKTGAVIVALIDLKTHSRWIRDKDPLNIYRYSETVYNIFGFQGAPNRVRPNEYVEFFKKHGWENLVVNPVDIVSEDYLDLVKDHLHDRFRKEGEIMGQLSIMLCATKK